METIMCVYIYIYLFIHIMIIIITIQVPSSFSKARRGATATRLSLLRKAATAVAPSATPQGASVGFAMQDGAP